MVDIKKQTRISCNDLKRLQKLKMRILIAKLLITEALLCDILFYITMQRHIRKNILKSIQQRAK